MRRERRPPAIVGVDVGGTTMAAGVVTAEGDVIVDESAPTRGGGSGDPLDAIVTSIRRVSGEVGGRYAIGAIGLGVPGPVDAARGRIGEPVHHVDGLAGRPLASEVTARVGLPTFLDNDVNTLALGELMFGAGQRAWHRGIGARSGTRPGGDHRPGRLSRRRPGRRRGRVGRGRGLPGARCDDRDLW